MRLPIGNYPKFAGYVLKWYLSKYIPKGTTILLRGRKPNRKKMKKDGYVLRRTSICYPLKYSKRVGIYIIDKQQMINTYNCNSKHVNDVDHTNHISCCTPKGD